MNYLLSLSMKNIDRFRTLVVTCSRRVASAASDSFVSSIRVLVVGMEKLDATGIMRMLEEPFDDSGSEGVLDDSDLDPDFEDSADAGNYHSTSFLVLKIISGAYCIMISNS